MVNFKKLVTPLSFKLETVIWSHDTGYWIPCFDRCQLSKTWMSNINIKDVGCEYCHHVLGEIIFHPWADVPAIHAATHVDHEKCMVSICICMRTCGSPHIVIVLSLAALWATRPLLQELIMYLFNIY